jgi:hypothetical protein
LREVEVAPSPKLQLQAVTLPSASVLRSVKAQVSPVQLEVKSADGSALVGLTSSEVEPSPPRLSVTVRTTV